MRTFYAALCLSAFALTTGCQSTSPNAADKALVQANSNQALRLGPPDVDFKSEFGFEGQRSNRQVAITTTTYTLKKGLLDKGLTWEDKPVGVKSWSAGERPGLISPDAKIKLQVIKADRKFVEKELPAYLEKHGVVKYSGGETSYGLDGMTIPSGFGDISGYLSQVTCKSGESNTISPGILNRLTSYVVTPKIVNDKVIFINFDLNLTTDATEPSLCNGQQEPSENVQVRYSTGAGFSANVANDEAIIISGIRDEKSEENGEVRIMTIVAQEVPLKKSEGHH